MASPARYRQTIGLDKEKPPSVILGGKASRLTGLSGNQIQCVLASGQTHVMDVVVFFGDGFKGRS